MSAPSPPAAAAPEPTPVEVTEFFCYVCESSVSLPVPAAHPMAQARRPRCPLCLCNFLVPGPSPFPELDPAPLPPGFLSDSEDSDGPVDFDELDDIEMINPADARFYITRFIQDRLYAFAAPEDVAAATAAEMSLLDDHIPGAEPPAPAASISVLPTVEVSDPTAVCAVCREDLPLASAALKLPCSHLYHSLCIVPWLEMHNTCPICRSRLPVPATVPVEASSSEQDPQTTHITIRLTTTARRRVRVSDGVAEAPVSASPTQLAQALTGEGGGGPTNSGETVSSDWPQHPESDTVMSEARNGHGFFD